MQLFQVLVLFVHTDSIGKLDDAKQERKCTRDLPLSSAKFIKNSNNALDSKYVKLREYYQQQGEAEERESEFMRENGIQKTFT